ncbi:hypothetical protein DSM112329_03593 [Paraconexibacter sp. AEG42_29]|uniref:DUF3556 domain-containing protein n=1 Tax=Paraconexibacter sp. AEG42_29 TaxID=2997339 RepID=A0AAU7AYB9_9ACTN
MGLKEGDFPPVDPATFEDMTYQERIKTLSRHWAEFGFGAPKITAIIYIVKLLVFFCIGGILVGTLTSDLDPLSPSEWWDQPIFWQKAVIWTMMLEALGVAGSWGPLAGHFKPMTGGVLYYARTGTLRNPPWPSKVPATAGFTRTPVDVALYLTFIGALVVSLALPGTTDVDTVAGVSVDLVERAPMAVAIVALALLGLRDKIAFLQARAEQYVPALIFFTLFDFVDMVVAAKLLIVIVWCGAAFSKVGPHFANVIPPMVSNTPWLSHKGIKRMHYRNFPEDMRPSERATGLAHGAGTLVEFGAPLVLLFSQNTTVTAIAAIAMIGFHLFIISTFPLAVPLDWNVLFAYITAFLFLGFANYDGYDLAAMDTGLLIVVVAGCLFFPILGNLRPDLVSFLPSMRQYSGNWATAMWGFAPGGEQKLNDHIKKPALMQKQQLTEIYGEEAAEVVMQQLLGWRSLHSQGRGLNSLMMKTLGPDIDTYTLREAEFSCNALAGFNFGDGHFHNQQFIKAIQSEVNYKPGEFIVVFMESDPWGPKRGRQDYWIMDAAVGVVETGSIAVKDCVKEQPWLPNGPVATKVDWTLDGYERVRYERPARPAPDPGGDDPSQLAKEARIGA